MLLLRGRRSLIRGTTNSCKLPLQQHLFGDPLKKCSVHTVSIVSIGGSLDHLLCKCEHELRKKVNCVPTPSRPLNHANKINKESYYTLGPLGSS